MKFWRKGLINPSMGGILSSGKIAFSFRLGLPQVLESHLCISSLGLSAAGPLLWICLSLKLIIWKFIFSLYGAEAHLKLSTWFYQNSHLFGYEVVLKLSYGIFT